MVAGVAGGIAEYFRIDPTLVRLAWALAIFGSGGAALIAYIAAAIIIPQDSTTSDDGAHANTEVDIDRQTSHPEQSNKLWGILLIVIGASLLARNFLRWLDFDKLWPGVLILLGVLIFISGRGGDKK
jgi:phage shock protein C